MTVECLVCGKQDQDASEGEDGVSHGVCDAPCVTILKDWMVDGLINTRFSFKRYVSAVTYGFAMDREGRFV